MKGGKVVGAEEVAEEGTMENGGWGSGNLGWNSGCVLFAIQPTLIVQFNSGRPRIATATDRLRKLAPMPGNPGNDDRKE